MRTEKIESKIVISDGSSELVLQSRLDIRGQLFYVAFNISTGEMLAYDEIKANGKTKSVKPGKYDFYVVDACNALHRRYKDANRDDATIKAALVEFNKDLKNAGL